MEFFGKTPPYRAGTPFKIEPSLRNPELYLVEREFDNIAKLDEVEDRRIQYILKYLKHLLGLFKRPGIGGARRLTPEQLEEEYHSVLPKIINMVLEVDADLKREINFCVQCGEKVEKGAVACPSCGVHLRG